MNPFDKRATEQLHKRTEQETDGLKEDIWNALEQELFTDKNGDVKTMKTRIIPVILTAAATLIIIFSLQTEPGMAFIKSIKELFVPEKSLIQNIEGQDEETDVHLNEGTNAEYIIYVDETRYKMINSEEEDIITTIEPLPTQYPQVSMEIKQVADEKPEELVTKVEVELKKDFPALRAIENVTEPVEGYLLHGAAGNAPDSKIVHTYVISNGKEGSFVITSNYFLEAAEGHGARFHHMLESFEIVE